MREVRDQALHYCIVFGAIVILSRYIPVVQSVALTLSVALVRELTQHNWKLKGIGRLDSFFYILGAAAAITYIHTY